jgi:hypothetical protein
MHELPGATRFQPLMAEEKRRPQAKVRIVLSEKKTLSHNKLALTKLMSKSNRSSAWTSLQIPPWDRLCSCFCSHELLLLGHCLTACTVNGLFSAKPLLSPLPNSLSSGRNCNL